MWESFLKWLRSLFGQPQTTNLLEKLDTSALRGKIVQLNAEREKMLSRVDKLKADRTRLLLEAQTQDDLRRRETGKQIVDLDAEIREKAEQLEHLGQQQSAVRQLISLGERVELLRRYGLDKLLGQKFDLGELDRQIQVAISDGPLNTDDLTKVTNMVGDALEFSRAVVKDEALLHVLEEINNTDAAKQTSDLSAAASPQPRIIDDPALSNVLREIDDLKHAAPGSDQAPLQREVE